MRTHQITYTREHGWSEPFPDLDSAGTLVLAFGGRDLAAGPAPLEELAGAYPSAVIAGCSSAGQIVGDRVSDAPLDVTIARFDNVTIEAAHSPIAPATSRSAGRELGGAIAGADAALVFGDGLAGNGSQLALGLSESLGGIPIGGALAADGDRFERTWVLLDGKATEGMAVAVGLRGGRLGAVCGSAGGWVGFGPERIVSRSQGNVVYELGGIRALDLYRDYLGDYGRQLPASGLLFPLSVRRDRQDPAPLVRTIIGIDEDAGSLVFAGDVPQGHRARLMTGSPDRLLDGAYTATSSLEGVAPEGGALAVVVSCVGRRIVYGPRAPEEAEIGMAALGASGHQCGLFSYGEIAPHGDGGCSLFNQTFTTTVLWEAAA